MKRIKIRTGKKVKGDEQIPLFIWDKWRKATLDE